MLSYICYTMIDDGLNYERFLINVQFYLSCNCIIHCLILQERDKDHKLLNIDVIVSHLSSLFKPKYTVGVF